MSTHDDDDGRDGERASFNITPPSSSHRFHALPPPVRHTRLRQAAPHKASIGRAIVDELRGPRCPGECTRTLASASHARRLRLQSRRCAAPPRPGGHTQARRCAAASWVHIQASSLRRRVLIHTRLHTRLHTRPLPPLSRHALGLAALRAATRGRREARAGPLRGRGGAEGGDGARPARARVLQGGSVVVGVWCGAAGGSRKDLSLASAPLRGSALLGRRARARVFGLEGRRARAPARRARRRVGPRAGRRVRGRVRSGRSRVRDARVRTLSEDRRPSGLALRGTTARGVGAREVAEAHEATEARPRTHAFAHAARNTDLVKVGGRIER